VAILLRDKTLARRLVSDSGPQQLTFAAEQMGAALARIPSTPSNRPTLVLVDDTISTDSICPS
jgi:hypothetical protein